jgi:hypothetical protein
MRFMVIEHFKNRDPAPIYARFRARGRMMPDGLSYVDSWIEATYDRCFQVMETDDPELFRTWTSQWDDLMDFEIIPVVSSAEMRERFP